MKTLKHDIYWSGIHDPHYKCYEPALVTDLGVSCNAYIIKDTNKVALIDTVPEAYAHTYLHALESKIDLSHIDYIILTHAEPDHSGALPLLLPRAPQAIVVGSAACIRFLKETLTISFEYLIVNSGDVLALGNRSLVFSAAPFLHWPDAMMVYCPEENLLFSGDLFSTLLPMDGITDDGIFQSELASAQKHYYDLMLRPLRKHLASALSRLTPYTVEMIASSHGPIVSENASELIDLYKRWSNDFKTSDVPIVVLIYGSIYGYTQTLAEHIAKGLVSAGDLKVELFDIYQAATTDILEAVESADALLFGSPTINAEAIPEIWALLGRLNPIVHGRKHAAAFGSYGWSGEAVSNLTERLKQLRMTVHSGFRTLLKPNEDALMSAYKYGLDFGERLLNKQDLLVMSLPSKAPVAEKQRESLVPWRCIVCGEVFDGYAPPSVCPACGASEVQFEIMTEVLPKVSAVSGAAIIIVGNNAAGVAACEAIRKRSEDAAIILISEENDLGYYRPALPDYISDTHNEKSFYLHNMQWYMERYIDLRLNTRVVSVKPEAKAIVTDSGETLFYDKLILATGSANTKLPITDTHLAGIFSLKTKADADAMIAYGKSAQKLLVVGGGVLGLETAWEFKNLGLEVTVLEAMERLLPKQLDSEASKLLETSVKQSGIQIIKGQKVVAMLGDTAVTGVQLTDGQLIDADMVIIAAGVRPNKQLAESAGLDYAIGILVDDHMRTNQKDIYACGDVAEFQSRVPGLWAIATEQGKVAGANAVGDSIAYVAKEPATVFNGMGASIFSIGDVSSFETRGFESMLAYDKLKQHYLKLYFNPEGLFCGGILIGNTKPSLILMRGLAKGLSKSEMIAQVFVD